jgi:hypothetical protein
MSPEIVVLFHFRSLEIPRQATTWRRLFIPKTKGAFGLFRRFRCSASGVVTGMVRWRCGGAVAYWASGQARSLQMPAGVVVYGRGQGGNGMPRSPANGQTWHGGQDLVGREREIEFGFRMGGPTGSRRGLGRLGRERRNGARASLPPATGSAEWDDPRGAAEWSDSAYWRH